MEMEAVSSGQQEMDLMDKVNSLIGILQADLDACDFKWTLFIAAANHYKHDSLLKPFPSASVFNRVLNIHELRMIITSIPRLNSVLALLRHFDKWSDKSDEHIISDEAIKLLYWCLLGVKEPTLKSIGRSNVSTFTSDKRKHFILDTLAQLARNCKFV